MAIMNAIPLSRETRPYSVSSTGSLAFFKTPAHCCKILIFHVTGGRAGVTIETQLKKHQAMNISAGESSLVSNLVTINTSLTLTFGPSLI